MGVVEEPNAVRETLLEMERFKVQRSDNTGAGPGEGIRAGQSRCGLGLGDAPRLPKEDLAGALWALRAPAEGAGRRICGGAAPDHHGHSRRVKVELFAPAHCVAGRSEWRNTN